MESLTANTSQNFDAANATWEEDSPGEATELMFAEAQKHVEALTPKSLDAKDLSIFERNLEEVLNKRRISQKFSALHQWHHAIDFSSNDFLSLATSGLLRAEFLEELERHPDFRLGSTGSRLFDGNNPYSEALEEEIARFHGASKALILNSGYDANVAIFNSIPRPGDVILYDELVHASVHDGMKHSLTESQISFRHNDPESFRDVLEDIQENNPQVRNGQKCVLIVVEAVYSMDGDVCPLASFVAIATDVFPKGNAQFIIDEAHSTGLIGKQGRGLVCDLGLEEKVAIRLHTYGKGMSATGATIMCNQTCRDMLLNFGRPLIYTTAPSFVTLAAIRAGYNLLRAGKLCPIRAEMQRLVLHFQKCITTDPEWAAITRAGTCSIPIFDSRASCDYITQFVPVWTRERYNYFLAVHLATSNFSAAPINPPVVPRGTGRVRLVIHAGNTEKEVEALAASILTWAKEMRAIETGRVKNLLPKSMQRMQVLMAAYGNEAVSLTASTRYESHTGSYY